MNTLNPTNPANRRTANFQFDETLKPEFVSTKDSSGRYVISVSNVPLLDHAGKARCLTRTSVDYDPPYAAHEHYIQLKVNVLDRFRWVERFNKERESMPDQEALFLAKWLMAGIHGNYVESFTTGAFFNDEYIKEETRKLYTLNVLHRFGVR
jgi:hypothetical protein